MSYAVICHLFYPAIAKQLLNKLKHLNKRNTVFYINVQGNSDEHKKLYKQIAYDLDNVILLNAPNKGRDIGAKLLLIDLMFRLNKDHEFCLIIHDKKSPHLEDGNNWRDVLFRIINQKYINKIFEIFKEMPSVGVVGTSEYIQNEYEEISGSFLCNCNKQIKELLEKYNIHTEDYNFVAGNIFWIRTELLKDFFLNRSILQVRADLETGNVLDFMGGTYIHSWERIMSWIATSQGYKIYGI